MGRRQGRRFRPGLDSLESRQVLSASAANPVVHTAIVPVAVPIATYNSTFTQINDAFEDYEGTPINNALDAVGSFFSTVIDPEDNSSGDDDTVQGGKGDPNALEGRLQSAIAQLPGGQSQAGAMIGRTFANGGLTTEDAPYFKGKITGIVKSYVTQEIKRGDMILTWPGEAVPHSRS